MRKLKSNEKIIQEYEKFILIEVTCENGAKYRTTIDKWTQTDKSIPKGSNVDTWLENNYWKKI